MGMLGLRGDLRSRQGHSQLQQPAAEEMRVTAWDAWDLQTSSAFRKKFVRAGDAKTEHEQRTAAATVPPLPRARPQTPRHGRQR